MAPSIPHLMAQLRSGSHASSPRLTWYGPDGERIELSGRVLDNWVAKTANFLAEELDAEAGSRVRLDLPAHWKSVIAALAAWSVGGVVLGDADRSPADITFVSPESAVQTGGVQRGGAQIAVALGALDLSYPGDLPAGAYDYAALVRQFADSFDPFDAPDRDDPALTAEDGTFTQASLLSEFAASEAEGARILIDTSGGLLDVLSRLLGAWAAGGSAVLVHESVTGLDRISASERIG